MTASTLRPARQADLRDLLTSVSPQLSADAPLFLVGETSQVAEGWVGETGVAHFAIGGTGARPNDVEKLLTRSAADLGVSLLFESPAGVIPLPAGHETRARPVTGIAADGAVRHFDPYSVAFRVIARGDEPDYHVVLRYLRHSWVTVEEMDRLLAGVLPRFTRETIAQDPAEFRRKYRGLMQMWRAERPG